MHLKWPFYGARKLTRELQNQRHEVGRRHVTTLMRRMGMETIYRKPRTSIPAPLSAVYPYLLTGLKIERPNHVWAADLTPPGSLTKASITLKLSERFAPPAIAAFTPASMETPGKNSSNSGCLKSPPILKTHVSHTDSPLEARPDPLDEYRAGEHLKEARWEECGSARLSGVGLFLPCVAAWHDLPQSL